MRSVARRRQTGALLVVDTVNEEMKKGSWRLNQVKVFSQTHVFSSLLASVGSCHNMTMAVKMVSDLHQGTGASDLLFCVRWKRKSANPSTKTPSPGATAANLFDGGGVNNRGFPGEPDHKDIEDERAYAQPHENIQRLAGSNC